MKRLVHGGQRRPLHPPPDNAWYRCHRLVAERRRARDKLPQHDSKRVNVRPLVKGLAPVDLGRDVDHRARGAHRVDVGRLFDPREPEVADLDRDRGSLSGQQKVLRLDIPMHKPPPVKVPHPASALPRHPQPGRKGVVGCLPRTEVVPHVMLHQLRDYCKRGNLGDCPEKR
eukprot:CAMPEP_0114173676 /NCGR_PEP_ID=MMETSP0043_2-20121206/35974_1 /TAXON_ID=464988 /ORGANISM="Hemiselmis andersenii, Strain CCMP644" /LENGTH=170 /DNA_ID=CAMNT_0001271711 /DNA_START=168 /DNA_END=680 /DNA_ORIENTATION=+